MLRTIKTNILNSIQVAGEVNAALKEHSIVVVAKRQIGANYDQPVYDIYAGDGKVEQGILVQHQK
jgi:hypothetical protein